MRVLCGVHFQQILGAQAAESLASTLAKHEDQRALFRLGGALFELQQYSLARHAYMAALQASSPERFEG